MKTFKKFLGFILVASFIALGIGAFIFNIINNGWYFILDTIALLVIVSLFILGIYLLTDNK